MKIIGMVGAILGIFIVVLLLVFIYCCLIIGKDK
jgi:hypothetical protein